MIECRKTSQTKSSSLPVDYLKMVVEIFSSNFELGLRAYSQLKADPFFEAKGEITSSEIVLAVSLMNKYQISATTVYASSDFEPKASAPSVQEILAACLDAAGSVFATLLISENSENLANVADESLTALEGIPFDWTEHESNGRKIYLKVDKSNLALDGIADDWLRQHDPKIKDREAIEEEETKSLFITGPKTKV